MTRYLPIATMVLAALVTGIVLVPGAWEMAFMKLRDKDFAAAERVFEDKFLAGDRSRGVLLPLSELYVRNGRIDKAIGVLTKYAKAHPGDQEITARLAVLLQEAQETSRAIDALETLAAKRATPKNLRELDRLHDIAENTEGRIRALMRLAKLGAASAQESRTLTNLLAATGEKTQALTAAFNAIKQHGAKTPNDLVQVFAALAVDNQRRDLIASVVVPWAAAQTETAPLAAVASALVDKAEPAAAIAMVEASSAYKRQVPGTVVLAAHLQTATGSKDKALALYDRLRLAGQLPAAQDGDYVALALAQKKTDAALAHIAARGPQTFNDATLLYAIGQAALSAKADWLKDLDSRLTDQGGRPLPLARVALARGDLERAAAQAKLAEADGPTVTLAQLFAELGDLDSASRAFDASVAAADTVSVQDLAQATAVAIALKRGPMALGLADRLVLHEKSAEAAIQRARALTLTGQPQQALDILAKLKSASELADVAEIEALAAAKQYSALRTKLVARLSKDGLPAAQRTNIIFLLNDLKIPLDREAATLADGLAKELSDASLTGAPREARLSLLARIAPAKALPFFKAAAAADPDRHGYAYLALLKELKRTADLKAFLISASTAAKTAKVRDDFLYELLKHGADREVLPLLAERARTDGAKWFFAYDEALAKAGTRVERLSALQAFADLPATPREMRSQIAFQLLNLGDKARAETLFRALAEDGGPDSPEVRQLAFLWGPRPGAAARAWLKALAEKASEPDRARWAALLVNAGDATAAEAILSGAGDPRSVAALAGVYAETRRASALKSLIARELPGADGALAKALAQAADALSLSAEASSAYERAGMIAQAGRAAHFAGDPHRAAALLSRAGPGAEPSFYLAEALTALNRPGEAAAHYRAALAALGHGGEAQKMRIVALARLRDHAGADRALAEIAQDEDSLADARNAYAGALMDQGDTKRAAAQLGY